MKWLRDLIGAADSEALRAEVEYLKLKATRADNTIAELQRQNTNLKALVRAFRDVNADLDTKLCELE